MEGLRSWLSEGKRWLGWRDIAHVLSPLAPIATTLDYVARHDATRLADDVSARDPALIQWLSDGARMLARLFRLEVYGVHNLPRGGPALLVANHNGGLLPLDGLFTLATVCDNFGPERVLNPLGHDLILYDRVAHRFAEGAGILRAGHRSAGRALQAGHMVLVYPGSDIETFRRWSERDRVELAGRTGFLSLALRERVPIIPVVSAGTHEQWVVLSRGDALARALHTAKLLRTKVLPVALALPFGLTFGLLPYLPLPAQTSLAFGAPITWPDLGPELAEDPATLAFTYAAVTSAMQELLDALHVDRVPFIGQPRKRRAEVERLVARAPAGATVGKSA